MSLDQRQSVLSGGEYTLDNISLTTSVLLMASVGILLLFIR